MRCRSSEKPNANYKKGLWSPDEDQRLRAYILKHGVSCWSIVPVKAGLQRNGKSCRLRWINYLRPGLKRGVFSREEEETVMKLQGKLGNKWSQIAMHLPGRTDNEVKNYWNSYLKKKVMKPQGSDHGGPATMLPDMKNQGVIKYDEGNIQFVPIAECLEPLKSSILDPVQSMAHSTDEESTLTTLTHLPKILFSDWFSLNDAGGQYLSNLDNGITEEWHHKSSYAEIEGQASNGIVNGYNPPSSCEFNQGQFESNVQVPQNEFFDLFPGGEIYDSLDMYHDLQPYL